MLDHLAVLELENIDDGVTARARLAHGMHDWTLSAALMAKVLAAKGYHYQYVFARNAKHVDRPTVAQTLPAAMEWLWKGHPIP